MKKLLILVLLAVTFCTAIEEKVDEDIALIDWAGLWEKVKKYVDTAVNWLKDNGLWDPIVNFLKTTGRQAAMNWCTQKIPDFVCSSIIDFILGLLK